jgi:hypothetical protein
MRFYFSSALGQEEKFAQPIKAAGLAAQGGPPVHLRETSVTSTNSEITRSATGSHNIVNPRIDRV